MKHVISAVLLLCLTRSGSVAQTHMEIKAPDTVESDLAGQVQRMKVTSVKEQLFGDYRKSSSYDERTYDRKGNRLVKTKTGRDGSVESRIEHLYDEAGCLIREIVEDAEEKSRDELEISIDVRRKIIKKKNIKTNELRATLYTAAGFEDKIKEVESDGTVTETVEIKRLSNNKEFRLTYFDERGRRTRTVTIEWNKDGTQKAMKCEDHQKKSRYIVKYDYIKKDAQGNWVERIEHTTLHEGGHATPMTKTIVTREIEYY